MTYQHKMEFLIDGTWVDATAPADGSEVRGTDRVVITRGTQDQQSSLAPQTMSWRQNNRNGTWSNRNPLSPYYGKIPRNTRVRHSVLPLDAYALLMEPNDGSFNIAAADTAALRLTGDIDVRVELTGHYGWRPMAEQALAGKYATAANARSWLLRLSADGYLTLQWSTDGTDATVRTLTAPGAIPYTAGRLAVRCTLDVNNGAGGCTATFYTAPSLAGPWTSIGSATSAGTTSLYGPSIASLQFGSAGTGTSPIAGATRFYGKVHGGELYNGIAGTKVADYDPTGQALDDDGASWSDGLGNTWVTATRITSDHVRFSGEIGSVPPRWDTTGRDVSLPMTAFGALKRLMSTAQPLNSSIYRRLITYDSPVGYWPMEDGSGITTPSSAAGVTRSFLTNGASFSGTTPDGLDGSAGCVVLGSQPSKVGLIANGRFSTGSASFVFYFKLAALPASGTPAFCSFTTSGTARGWRIGVGSTSFQFIAVDKDGATLASSTVAFTTSPLNQWMCMSIVLTQSGSNVVWEAHWFAVGDPSWTNYTAGTSFAGTVGRIGSCTISSTGDIAYEQASIAHVLMTNSALVLAADHLLRDAAMGYAGEMAGDRLTRLAAEEGLTLALYGLASDTPVMGPQRIATVFDLFDDATSMDGGRLYEARDFFGLNYKTKVFLERRQYRGNLAFNYSDSVLSAPPEPVEDGSTTLNDITVTGPDGASARAVAEDATYGPLNVLDPPTGIGRMPGGLMRQVNTSSQLTDLAYGELFARTRDELRVTQLEFGLHRTAVTATLAEKIMALDIGGQVAINDWPATSMPPGTTYLTVFGYTESIDQFLWTIAANTGADVGAYTALFDIDVPARLDTNESTLTAGITSSATSMQITTTAGKRPWTTDPTDFPLPIMMDGEEITLSAISGASSPQTATISARSVNGVVKAHSAGVPIHVRDPLYLGL